jgi:hypothetical protein
MTMFLLELKTLCALYTFRIIVLDAKIQVLKINAYLSFFKQKN